jgi:hypothetical protein
MALLWACGAKAAEATPTISLAFDLSTVRVVSIHRARFFLGADTPFPWGGEKPVIIPTSTVSGYAATVLLEYPNLVVVSCPLLRQPNGTFGAPEMKWEVRNKLCSVYGIPQD